MKIVIIPLMLIITTQALTPEQKSKLEEHHKNCLNSSGSKPEQINKLRSGKFSGEPEVQKYVGCMMRSVGLINQSGQLQIDVLKSKVPKDMKKDDAMKLFLACKDKKGSNSDETAYLLYKCFYEKSPRKIQIDGQ